MTPPPYVMPRPRPARELRCASAALALFTCVALLVAPAQTPSAQAATPIKMFFSAVGPNGVQEGGEGHELWRSDGTSAGTRMVRDINPGRQSSHPATFKQLGSIMLFSAESEGHGRELWRTDGTREGTRMVKELFEGEGSGLARNVSTLGARMFGDLYFSGNFTRSGVEHGAELWRTDGTARGTQLVEEIVPGPGSSAPRDFVTYRDRIWFTVSDAEGNTDLWRTDGSAYGTRKVKDFALHGAHLGTIFEGKLYFRARNRNDEFELWRTNGTLRGTRVVAPIAGEQGRDPYDLTVAGDYLFFTNRRGLWRTDGTDGGTVEVRRTPTFPTIEAVGGWLMFRKPNTSNVDGVYCDWELWRTKGTRASTQAVRGVDFCAPEVDGSANGFTGVDGTLYFEAKAPGGPGVELWRSNGTADGTRMVKDVAQPGSSYPQDITDVAGDTFFFRALDPPSPTWELWRSDGTREGTRRMMDTDGDRVSNPAELTRFDP